MTGNYVSLNRAPASLFLFAIDIFEHMIHLFKSPAPSLWDEEECPDKGQETEDGEEGISPKTSVLYQRRRDQSLQLNIRSIRQ